MKLICEINENIQVITEATDNGEKSFFIEGVFMQAGIKNRNNRIYEAHILDREVNRYNEEYVKQNRAYGELGHPAGPGINLERVTHMIKSLKREGNDFFGRAKIMETPYGQIVKNLIKEGAQLGVSSRGMGSIREKDGIAYVCDDYHLATAADIVADPSAPSAFVQGIMEEREWIYSNGMFKEVDLHVAKKQVNESVRKRTSESEAIRIFESFINKL